MLKTETVTIDGVLYEIREQPVRNMLPLLGGEPQKIGIELAKMSVYRDGACLGEELLEIGFGDFRQLLEVVNRLHHLGEGDEGKESNPLE